MSRRRSVYRCADCGATSPRWTGRCPACGEWNAVVETLEERPAAGGGCAAVALRDVDGDSARPVATGIGELDRVLGGGLVAGSMTLVGGEPGIGKSTLLLQAVTSIAACGRRCLLACAEESPQQVRQRAERLGPLLPGLWVVDATTMPRLFEAVDALAPDVLVVDSIQTVTEPGIDSGPGSVAQVRACAAALTQLTKARGMATVLVGHVTKEGTLAGPRVLEHMVDTVLTFEGERHHALRLLRAVKHRFGPTGELGLFEMTDGGLRGVPDPSGLFLGDRRHGAAGSVVFPAMEGHRPLLVELQALVAGGGTPIPRRSASGLDAGRLALLVAVLEERAGVALSGRDVYVSVVGGVRVSEPGADLGTCLALASAAGNTPMPADLVICGEVGLAGEIRQVANTPRRLAEAARLGFRRAVVPVSAEVPPACVMQVTRVATLADALAGAGLSGADHDRRSGRPEAHGPRRAERPGWARVAAATAGPGP